MKSEKTQGIIMGIGHVESINNGVDRRQIIKIKEPGFVHPEDKKRNGQDNHHEVELWNGAIEKFNITANYRQGQAVEFQMWQNGRYRKTINGDLKHEKQTAMANIRPL